jgi:hypothetical protein
MLALTSLIPAPPSPWFRLAVGNCAQTASASPPSNLAAFQYPTAAGLFYTGTTSFNDFCPALCVCEPDHGVNTRHVCLTFVLCCVVFVRMSVWPHHQQRSTAIAPRTPASLSCCHLFAVLSTVGLWLLCIAGGRFPTACVPTPLGALVPPGVTSSVPRVGASSRP